MVRQSSLESNEETEASPCYKILNGAVYFNANCEESRPFCASICCRSYAFVVLTEQEAKSGRYFYKEASDACECDVCKKMRKQRIKYILCKLPDGSCVYLDGTRKCSIYENRPETCKKYSCVNVPFIFNPVS